MSKVEILRAVVSERLTAAAEEIFALFERTIAEYEEELCRSREENKRKQQHLDSILMPKVVVGIQTLSTSPGYGPSLNQEIPEVPRIKDEKEEENLKQVELHLPHSVYVKSEEPSLLQEQTENQEEMQGMSISPDPHFHSDAEGDTDHSSDTGDVDDGDWKLLFSCAAAQMKTESDGDNFNQDQTRDGGSAAQNSDLSFENKPITETVNNGDTFDSDKGHEDTKHQCSVCGNIFKANENSCSVCRQAFNSNGATDFHRRLLAGEKTFTCSFCNKAFTKPRNLKEHISTHTQEKPYSCLLCNKTFRHSGNLSRHKKIHTGEKPYSCTVCNKRFALISYLKIHMKTHMTEAPYSCLFCNKTFLQKCKLVSHTRTHTGEKPFSCTVCQRGFANKSTLKNHKETCR